MRLFSIRKDVLGIRMTLLGKRFYVWRRTLRDMEVGFKKKEAELRSRIGRKEKIRVGFLVSEQSKWQYHSVYEEMEKSEEFEPVVLVTQLLERHRGKKSALYYKSIEECYHFFASRGMRVRYAYDRERHRYATATELGVDVLFYQQPHQVHDNQHPIAVGKECLTCYVSYCLHLMEKSRVCMEGFHDMMWRMFVEDPQQMEHELRGSHCVHIGYPKFDAYFHANRESGIAKPILIYAPHHAFEANGLACATFRENGEDMLRMAQRSKDTYHWVFKPHPRFRHALVGNEVMTPEQVDAYYAEWAALGEVCEDGNYYDLFAQSAGMITDCMSFLGEYLPSGHPLFHFVAPGVQFNRLANSFLDAYYRPSSVEELEELLAQVILRGQDDLRELRHSRIGLLYDEAQPAAVKLVNHLRQTLHVG